MPEIAAAVASNGRGSKGLRALQRFYFHFYRGRLITMPHTTWHDEHIEARRGDSAASLVAVRADTASRAAYHLCTRTASSGAVTRQP